MYCTYRFVVRRGLFLKPERESINVGSNLTITCDSLSNVKWYFNHGALPKNTHTYKSSKRENVLHIYDAQYDNAGKYSCRYREETVTEIVEYEGKSIVAVVGTTWLIYHNKAIKISLGL